MNVPELISAGPRAPKAAGSGTESAPTGTAAAAAPGAPAAPAGFELLMEPEPAGPPAKAPPEAPVAVAVAAADQMFLAHADAPEVQEEPDGERDADLPDVPPLEVLPAPAPETTAVAAPEAALELMAVVTATPASAPDAVPAGPAPETQPVPRAETAPRPNEAAPPPAAPVAAEMQAPEPTIDAADPAKPADRAPDEKAAVGERPTAAPATVEQRPATPAPAAIAAAPAQAENPVAAPAPSGGEWRLALDGTPSPARHGADPPQAAGPLAPQALASQITVALVRAKEPTVDIRLDPPELGRVQIQLSQGETGLHAVVLAERPETGDLLRRHADLLARELAAAGFRDVSLDFATGGQAAPNRDETRFAGEPAAAERALPAPEPAPLPWPRPGVAGGLDIRL